MLAGTDEETAIADGRRGTEILGVAGQPIRGQLPERIAGLEHVHLTVTRSAVDLTVRYDGRRVILTAHTAASAAKASSLGACIGRRAAARRPQT